MIKFLFIFLMPHFLFAGGDSVGNGGVIWACVSSDAAQALKSGKLTDLFEAQEQYQWPLISTPGQSIDKIYSDRKIWVETTFPELYKSLSTKFKYVEDHLTFVNAELLATDDYNNAIKPLASSCRGGTWLTMNIANFREEDQQILISKELWMHSEISNLDKASLLFHEVIYYWMRTYFAATNSDKARKLTGLLFSTLTSEQIQKEMQKILGYNLPTTDDALLCTMKNVKRNQIYIAYGKEEFNTSIEVRKRCQDDPDANWCNKSSLTCEALGSSALKQCVAENTALSKLYIGKGRNILEAQFSAHMACYIGSQSVSGANQSCPEFTFMECN
jgi:hypothetical protein